jgi:hypothetical protein
MEPTSWTWMTMLLEVEKNLEAIHEMAAEHLHGEHAEALEA